REVRSVTASPGPLPLITGQVLEARVWPREDDALIAEPGDGPAEAISGASLQYRCGPALLTLCAWATELMLLSASARASVASGLASAAAFLRRQNSRGRAARWLILRWPGTS